MARSRDSARTFVKAPPDPAAIVGLVCLLGMIGLAIGLGAQPRAFLDLPSILIVVGGTLAATTISMPLRDLIGVPAALASALSLKPTESPRRVALECIAMAELVRREDIRLVDQHANLLQHRPIVQRGLRLVLDGTPAAQLNAALHREIAAFGDRGARMERTLRRAAEVAPAMGLIGTLIGLVQMLGQLEDPAAIGPAMAVALLTTFYGAVLSYGILTPLAERLGKHSENERILQELELLTVMSIAERENPRRLETTLNCLLAPVEQLEEFA